MMRDFKYLLAYTIPLSAVIGLQWGSLWSYTTVIYAFGLIPLWEALIKPNSFQFDEDMIQSRLANRFFDGLLYFNVILVYTLLIYGLWMIIKTPMQIYETIGCVLSLGIVIGTNGINVAHELGHRSTQIERTMAKILLLPALYMHFYIEHNFGHHLHVGTPKDPATSKKNQTVFSFWISSISGQIKSAVILQKKLLKNRSAGFFSIYNDFFYYQLFQLIYLIVIGYFFGIYGVFIAICIAMVGVLLLETINYIEHYGLVRELNGKRYERVTPMHSWNSNHAIGRLVLYELTRHSDHHHRASKKYQILESIEESPQLPYGYTTSMLIALIPPVWFKMMNKRIPKRQAAFT